MVMRAAFLLLFVAFVRAQNNNAQSQVQQADSFAYGQNQGGFGQNQGAFGQNQGAFGQNQGAGVIGGGLQNPQVPMGGVGLAQGPGFGQFQNPYMNNNPMLAPGFVQDQRRFMGGYGMRKLNFIAN
jgi:hypothetical protein